MAMTKAEGWGLGAAIVAHLGLFALLSFNFLHFKDPRFAARACTAGPACPSA
jgi:hypothetical protein